MPQPINRIVPDPHCYLDNKVLSDKPELAILVTQIFSTWARIEQRLNFLLVRVLGADSAPALAMFATLTAQHLQVGALLAAAEASFPADEFDVFHAAISVADGAQTPRNHLAHWAWGGCKQKPELLTLANPKMLHQRDFRVAKKIHAATSTEEVDIGEVAELNLFDASEILAYSKADIERALRDLNEAYEILGLLEIYIDPRFEVALGYHYSDTKVTHDELRDSALQLLNEKRLFREALGRRVAGRKSNPRLPHGSNPQGPARS
jgi:hypothetical protein